MGVEFYSLSKTYNMAGCRIGFAVGNSEVLANLAMIKSNIDYGVFLPVQEAGIAALTGPQDCVASNARAYQRRRDILVDGLAELGWKIPKPNASMFLWAPLPPGYTSSTQFVADFLEKQVLLLSQEWPSVAGVRDMSGLPWFRTKAPLPKLWSVSVSIFHLTPNPGSALSTTCRLS